MKHSAACALPLLLVLGACGSGDDASAPSTTASVASSPAASSSATRPDVPPPDETAIPLPTSSASAPPAPSTSADPATPTASSHRRVAVGATGTVTSRSGAVTLTLPPGMKVQADSDPEHDLAAVGPASRLLVAATTTATLAQLTDQVHTMCIETIGTKGTLLGTDDLVLDGEKAMGCTGRTKQDGGTGYALMYVTEHAGRRYLVAAMNTTSSPAADRQLHDAATSIRFT